ncbi:hypothetical protein ACLOJK_024811 [Asimina triloba]
MDKEQKYYFYGKRRWKFPAVKANCEKCNSLLPQGISSSSSREEGRRRRIMAQLLSLHPPNQRGALCIPSSKTLLSSTSNSSWENLKQRSRTRHRFSCLFADNHRKQEQARKSLESALGGKKSEFDKWDKEIKKREQLGGGAGGVGGWGGWFGGGGGGGWFGGSNGEHFWQEAQQATLALLGIVAVGLLISKGDVLFAVAFNSLLFVLRWFRNALEFATWRVSGRMRRSSPVLIPSQTLGAADGIKTTAKENVVRKWGMD